MDDPRRVVSVKCVHCGRTFEDLAVAVASNGGWCSHCDTPQNATTPAASPTDRRPLVVEGHGGHGHLDIPLAEREPRNVIEALARVQAEIGGIDKMTVQERRRRGLPVDDESKGPGYAYRGIDQISAAAQPLFGKYGIVIVPEISSWDVQELIINNKPWTETVVTVNWSIYGPGGVNDCISARTVGQGRDNSDKGHNKAITGAYKNLLLRLLSIGDPKDDTDRATHEADSRTPDRDVPRKDPRVVAAFEALRNLTDDQKTEVRELADTFDEHLTEAAFAGNPTWLTAIEEYLANIDKPSHPNPAQSDSPPHADPALSDRPARTSTDLSDRSSRPAPDLHDRPHPAVPDLSDEPTRPDPGPTRTDEPIRPQPDPDPSDEPSQPDPDDLPAQPDPDPTTVQTKPARTSTDPPAQPDPALFDDPTANEVTERIHALAERKKTELAQQLEDAHVSHPDNND